MPRKKSNLDNACIRKARLKRALRARESEEETAARNAAQRIRTAEIRRQESQEQRDKRLGQNLLRTRTARQQNIARFRELERTRQQTRRALKRASFFRLAFEYEPDINYSAHSKITIGAMDKICQYCHALKFPNETTGMCCASGKNVLPPLPTPPEPSKSLLAGESDDSKLFLQSYNDRLHLGHKCNECGSEIFGVKKEEIDDADPLSCEYVPPPPEPFNEDDDSEFEEYEDNEESTKEARPPSDDKLSLTDLRPLNEDFTSNTPTDTANIQHPANEQSPDKVRIDLGHRSSRKVLLRVKKLSEINDDGAVECSVVRPCEGEIEKKSGARAASGVSVTMLGASVTELKPGVSRLETGVTMLGPGMTKLQTGVTKLQTGVTKLLTGVTTSGANVTTSGPV